jgi:hypothetical protein
MSVSFPISCLDFNDILGRVGLHLSGPPARDQLMAQGLGPPGWIVAPSGSSYIRYPAQGLAPPGRGGAPGVSSLTHTLGSNTAAALSRWSGTPGASPFTRYPTDATATALTPSGLGGTPVGNNFTRPPDRATATAAASGRGGAPDGGHVTLSANVTTPMAMASAPFTWRRLQAGGVFRTGTRPTVNRRIQSAGLYEYSH